MDGHLCRLSSIIWYASNTHKKYYSDRILHVNDLLVSGPTSAKEQASSTGRGI